jgi:CheY-like chemotaxis protein
MNLATNSMQAMPTGGSLRIQLSRVKHPKERMTTTGPLPSGDYLMLRVQDSGAGIDPAIREKIFDPFFTTKDVGTGTGLGLSLVHGIVTDLGGAIDVETELGVGSCFTTYLPRSAGFAESKPDVPLPLARGKSERVLLVDDEEALVRLSSDMLTELGYRPAGFTSAAKALEAFNRDPGSFDAVITDSRMPQMSGVLLIKALRQVQPDVPILLVSGFLASAAITEARMAGADVILNKPVSRRELALALSEALSGSSRDGPALD